MAKIEDLIAQIPDERLKNAIGAEVQELKRNKKFGLVFEEHLPETVRLPKLPVKEGELVAKKREAGNALWRVKSIRNGIAALGNAILGEPRRLGWEARRARHPAGPDSRFPDRKPVPLRHGLRSRCHRPRSEVSRRLALWRIALNFTRRPLQQQTSSQDSIWRVLSPRTLSSPSPPSRPHRARQSAPTRTADDHRSHPITAPDQMETTRPSNVRSNGMNSASP